MGPTAWSKWSAGSLVQAVCTTGGSREEAQQGGGGGAAGAHHAGLVSLYVPPHLDAVSTGAFHDLKAIEVLRSGQRHVGLPLCKDVAQGDLRTTSGISDDQKRKGRGAGGRLEGERRGGGCPKISGPGGARPVT